jgi:arginine exporter protein ArgO
MINVLLEDRKGEEKTMLMKEPQDDVQWWALVLFVLGLRVLLPQWYLDAEILIEYFVVT